MASSSFSGSIIGAIDVYSVSNPPTPKAKLARYLHITVPTTTAFISFVAARDFLGVVSEKMGGQRDADWTFFAAMAAPGSIIGSWCK